VPAALIHGFSRGAPPERLSRVRTERQCGSARSLRLCALRLVPFGKNWRRSPFVFSFVRRCHRLRGCGSMPAAAGTGAVAPDGARCRRRSHAGLAPVAGDRCGDIHGGTRAGVVVVAKDADLVLLPEPHGPSPQLLWVTCGNVSHARLRAISRTEWGRAAALSTAGEPLVEVRGGR
jgi:hypothetical protein